MRAATRARGGRERALDPGPSAHSPSREPMLHSETIALIVQDAPAGGGAPAGPAGGAPAPRPTSMFDMLVPIALCGLVIYFMMIRPQNKARKQREQMMAGLKKGDRVMTTGGLYGTIAQIHENMVTLQVDEGVRLKYALSAVQGVVDDSGTEVKPEAKTDGKVGEKTK